MTYGDQARSLHSLIRLATVSITFTNAYATAPETVASLMSLLSGMSPLEHGYLGRKRGPLADESATLAERLREQGYLTAAFTEGEGADGGDLVFGSGFERGFDFFDPTGHDDLAGDGDVLHVDAPETGASTIERALAWLESNEASKSMLFIRLRPLPADDATAPDAFAERDRQLADLVRHIREDGNTCALVTAPCGVVPTLATAPGADALTEAALRVPLVFFVPGARPGDREDILSHDDATFVLLRVAAGEKDFIGLPEPPKEGMPAQRPAPISTEAVAVSGDPLALSLRTEQWRLTWQTGVSRLAPATNGDGRIALYDVARIRRGAAPANVAARNKTVVSRLQQQLQLYLDTHLQSRQPSPQ
jgi:hypothetical protein